jgi:hypothetical protein
MESGWIDAGGQAEPKRIAAGLRSLGWRAAEECWQESIPLSLNEALLRRWFEPGATFRTRLEAKLGELETQAVEHRFRQELGTTLRQRLEHTLLLAKRMPARPGGGTEGD